MQLQIKIIKNAKIGEVTKEIDSTSKTIPRFDVLHHNICTFVKKKVGIPFSTLFPNSRG
jgi:hypothetical protein